jgi:TP901 family phage tail tape measure protein
MQSALYDIFSSTDANMAQAKVLLEAFAKAAVAGQVSIEDSSRSTMSIMNAFKIPFQDVNKVLDKQFQLVRKGVGTYAQFSSVIGKLTPSAVRLGQNLDTMDATLIFLTRNGLSTASAVASAARAMDALANPNTTRKLDLLGIKSRDASGKFLPLIDILKNMRKYLLALPPPDRAAALFDIFKGSGGTIQAKRFFDLVLPNAKSEGNLKQFETFLNDMKGSTGQFSQAYNTMASTVAAKTQLLDNNWQIMKVTIGQALEPVYKKLLDIGAKVIGWFNKLSPSQQASMAKWALVGAAITAVTGIILLIIGGLGALAAALSALGLGLGAVLGIVGGVAAAFVILGAAIYEAYKGSAPIRQLFKDIGQTFSDVWNQDILPFVQGVKQAFENDLLPALHDFWGVISNNVIPVLDDLWNRIGSRLIKVLAETGRIVKEVLGEAFKYISLLVTNFVIPAIKDLTKMYNQHKGAIDKVLWVIGQLIKWFAIIAGGAVMVGMLATLAAVVVAFYAIVKIITTTIGFISRLVGWIKDAWNWMGNFGDSVNRAAGRLGNAIKGGFNDVIHWFERLPGVIGNAVRGFGSLLINAGHDLIMGLLNGINRAFGAVMDRVRALGNMIKTAFNAVMNMGSPSRVMAVSGAHVVDGIGVGFDKATPALLRKVKNLAGNMKSRFNVSTSKANAPVVPVKRRGSGGEGRQVVLNVYTQEVRPEYHAQQLGQLIASTY